MQGMVEINMDEYLVRFVTKSLGTQLTRKNWLGELVISCLSKVPEDCYYVPYRNDRKTLLLLSFNHIYNPDSGEDYRPEYNYYLPRSKQVYIEKSVKGIFDTTLFQLLDMAGAVTEKDISARIEWFCQEYDIDFARNFDMLKQKYYRHRNRRENFSKNCHSTKNV